MSAEVRIENAGALAVVTLRHGARANAMSLAMWQQLRAGFERIGREDALRCVVVCGEGGHFCAGGEPGWSATVEQARQRIAALAPQAARMHKRMLRSLTGAATPETADTVVAGAGGGRQDLVDALVAGAYDYADTPEHREGITAFLGRRKPQF